MEHSWLIEKVLPGLAILGLVVIAALRLGGGLAAVAGLGQFPMSMIPARLRRFIFGERKDPTHKLNN